MNQEKKLIATAQQGDVEHHADVTVTGRDHRTVLQVARDAGRHEVAELIAEKEKAGEKWRDPRAPQKYCKAYYLKDLREYPQWPATLPPAETDPTGAVDEQQQIVYLHQDYTVTKSVWPGEGLLFSDVVPEWVRFCESELRFSTPGNLQ